MIEVADVAEPKTEEARIRSLGNELVALLAVLLRNTSVHPADNAVFETPLARVRGVVHELLDNEGVARLESRGGQLYMNGRRLRPQFRNFRTFADLEKTLRARALGGIAFTRQVDADTLTALLELLVASPCEGEGEGEGVGEGADQDAVDAFNTALDLRGACEVRALAPRTEDLPSTRGRQERALRAYHAALELIREYMTGAQSPQELSARQAKRIVHQLVDLSFEEGRGFALAGLTAIRGHHEYTFNHMVNVGVLAIAFGQRLGLGRQRLAQLGLAALYHDVGKLHVPAALINKRERLTEEEWTSMGNHTVYAARTLFPTIAHDLDAIPRIVTALQHHRRLDGTGYPPLRLLERQSFFARVTAIVDSYDAMTTIRSYQNARLPHEAIRELWAHAGTMYDRVLVKAFINCMGVFPVGSVVLLATGETAVVCQPSADPERLQQPLVRIAVRDGRRLAEPELVDLAHPSIAVGPIVRCIDPDEAGLDPIHFTMATGAS